jgi:hypothetical protein
MKRMTEKELAYYYVGQAVVMRINKTERDRLTATEFQMLLGWLNDWMPTHRKELVNKHLDINFDDPHRPFPRLTIPGPDDIPF